MFKTGFSSSIYRRKIHFFSFFTGFINLTLDVILGRCLGVFGIFLATFIARLSTNLWYEPYAVYRYGLKKSPWIYWKRYAYFIMVLVVAGGLSYLLCRLCDFSAILNTLLKFIICCFIPNAVFLFFFRKTPELAYLKRKAGTIKNRLTRMFNK